MSSSVRLAVVCRLSVVCLHVTFERPTQAIEIFGNIFTPFCTLAIYDLCIKNLRRSSQGNPSVGGVKQKRGSPILDLSTAITQKRCKIGGKLLLIINRKSYTTFRLVPKWVTLNDLKRRNSPNGTVISPNSVAFGRIM